MLFDLNFSKLLVLAVIAVVIFGPDQLPKIATQAGRALRELRRLADGAREDLREGLGPEFSDFDLADLHPRNLVRKHLLDGLDGVMGEQESLATVMESAPALAPGESPPYDPEAT
ncbi:MAG TPA: sec-independent translocase [Streptosporangiaceae bacterium]